MPSITAQNLDMPDLKKLGVRDEASGVTDVRQLCTRFALREKLR